MASSDNKSQEVIHTRIWDEQAEPDNPFAAAVCRCAGYDVYGELLQNARWAEYLYLLFTLERPKDWQTQLLEKIAIAIANPGVRDHSVRAAMNAGVGGSTNASALMAALAVGAGQYTGAREVFLMMQWWKDCRQDLHAWEERIKNPPQPVRGEVWLPMEHTPGFDPHGASCPTPVIQTLDSLASIYSSGNLGWLQHCRTDIENMADNPLAMTGVIATAFSDLNFSPDQGEMLYLLLRLPGAAAHALEQKELGWRKYPFFMDALHIESPMS